MSKSNKKLGHKSFSKTTQSNKVTYLPDREARVAKVAYQKAKSREVAAVHERDDGIAGGQELNL